MKNVETHKIVSLKLATLSQQDQKWLLNQLPKESSEKIRQSLKVTKNLGAKKAQQLLQSLQSATPKEVNSSNVALEQSEDCEFSQHLQKVNAGEVSVTEAVRRLLNDVNSEAEDVSH